MAAAASGRSEVVIGDVFARHTANLNGQWHVIFDPYDMGCFDYRRQPCDEAAKPSGGVFLDRQPKDKTELIEYNFDTSQTWNVPGDWNSQRRVSGGRFQAHAADAGENSRLHRLHAVDFVRLSFAPTTAAGHPGRLESQGCHRPRR